MLANLPVRYKVTAIAVVTTAVVLLLASALFVLLEINNYRRALEQELTAIAQITSSNSSAAILFHDGLAARETLGALGARPNIESASLYLPGGAQFARYGVPLANQVIGAPQGSFAISSTAAGADPYVLTWSSSAVDLHGPITFDGETIGFIHLRSNLDQIYATFSTYLGVVLLIVAAAMIVAWLLAVRLQKQVTSPIHGLLSTMQTVARDRNYTVRANKLGDDELGALVDGFNEMLADTEAHKRELNAARREAEAASRMKSEFLAHMSHELRTPLNAILGFSDFMLVEPLGPLGHTKYREYTLDIKSGGKHLLGVINDILDLSKVEAGAAELYEEVFDAEDLVIECGRMLRERAISASIDLRLDIARGLPRLFGDPQLVKRGLINLISNALKFTPAGGQVCVRAYCQSDGVFVISVVDNGIGIEPAKLAHVLTPFGQAEHVLSRSHDGTGLGLPLVKSFVELHGGRLDLQSTVGSGTEVSMRLPANRVRLRPIEGDGGAKEAIRISGYSGPDIRVDNDQPNVSSGRPITAA